MWNSKRKIKGFWMWKGHEKEHPEKQTKKDERKSWEMYRCGCAMWITWLCKIWKCIYSAAPRWLSAHRKVGLVVKLLDVLLDDWKKCDLLWHFRFLQGNNIQVVSICKILQQKFSNNFIRKIASCTNLFMLVILTRRMQKHIKGYEQQKWSLFNMKDVKW